MQAVVVAHMRSVTISIVDNTAITIILQKVSLLLLTSYYYLYPSVVQVVVVMIEYFK